jgi:hypothetical protein
MDNMKILTECLMLVLKYVLIIGGLIFWFFVAIGLYVSNEEKVYDCSLAEISPDFPLEVKDACRRMKLVERRTET